MKISSFFLTTANADLFLPRAENYEPIIRNFADSVKYCKDHFSSGSTLGTLADPTRYSKHNLLEASHQISAWVEAYRASGQNKFFPISRESTFLELVYADEPDGLMWSAGEPNNAGGYEYCAMFRVVGEMMDQNCFKSRPFLCEGEIEKSESRSESSHPIVDAVDAAKLRERQRFENQHILFNDFLDLAIEEADEMSKEHARKLTNLKKILLSKIQFSDRELCGESLYDEDKYQNEFYYWNQIHTISEHENVCDIFRDVHDGIIHFIHEFGCTGNVKVITKRFTKLIPSFCPDLNVVKQPLGIDF